jgi:hypothetical protein
MKKFKKISNYEDFILESIINETIIHYSPVLRDIIADIYREYNSTEDQKIADMAYKIYSKENTDIDADITMVDKSDKVGYLTHSRLGHVKKLADDIFNPEVGVSRDFIDRLWKEDQTSSGKGFFTNKLRGEIKISKLVNKLLENEKQFTEGDKERFVNLIKSKLSTEDKFIVASGDEIANYYKSSNYSKETGTLGNSCMRRKSANVFRIYTENPEKCSIVVMLDEDDKVLGRALLWNLDYCSLEGVTKFMDRIYTANDYDLYKFRKWAKENGYAYKARNTYSDLQGIIFNEEEHEVEMSVNLKKMDYNNFPYLDTFRLYDPSNHKLINLSVDEDDSEYSGFYILSSTDGDYTEIASGNYSEWHDQRIPEDQSVYSDYLNDYLRRDDSVEVERGSRRYRGWYPSDYDDIAYNNIEDEYYHINDAVYSEYHDTYILSDESTNVVKKVYSDGDVSTDDYYLPDSDEGDIFVSYSNLNNMLWYQKLTEEWSDWNDFSGVLIEENLIKDYKNEWVVVNFYFDTHPVIGKEDSWLNEIDAKILGVKIDENKTRVECLFEYYDRVDLDDILRKSDRKIKKLENLIDKQTVIDFGDGEKEKYIERLKEEVIEIKNRKSLIEEYKAVYEK